MAQIDPNTVQWDPAPQPVETPKGKPGGVILTDPTVVAKEQRAESAEERAARAEGRAISAEARAEESSDRANRLSVSDTDAINRKIDAFSKLLGSAQTFRQNFSGLGSGIENTAQEYLDVGTEGQRNWWANFKSADNLIRNELFGASLSGGEKGAYGETTVDPNMTPEIVQQNLDQRIEQARSQLKRYVGSLEAAGYNQDQIDALLGDYAPILRDDKIWETEKKRKAWEPKPSVSIEGGARTSPLEGGGAEEPQITGQGETFLTPEDRELLGRLTQAYQSGASLDELKAISAEYNRPFPISTEEELAKARREGRAITVDPSGRKTALQETFGSGADTTGGSYAISAANGLLSGGLDEIVGVMGGDAEAAQAAKEALRRKYPEASFAGEVAGQGMQTALTGPGAKAIGIAGKGLAALPVVQGAAYGAGETNDNRLLGAGEGAVASYLGGKLVDKLVAPGVRTVISKIAKDNNVPEEVVDQVVREALDEVPATPLSAAAQTEAGELARKAVGVGPAAKAAREKLAVMAAINPDARAAAERLGMELPLDILSDSAQLKTLTGLARSQIGSDAQAAWGQAVSTTVKQADEALEALGATPDISQVGDDVMTRLMQATDSLERQGAKLRDEVTAAIDVRDRVDATKLQGALGEVIGDMGGLAEAKQAFSSEEKKLLAMLGEGKVAKQPTYARLNDMRDQIGKALFEGRGPWVDTSQANLAKYYGALADDQLAYIERKGGTELADKMRASNSLFSKMYDSRRAMQGVFGPKLEKDLAPLINRAVTSATKGDAQALRTLMETVPEDMRGQVLLSGIMANSTRRSAGGGFSFDQFTKLYRGLRQNAPVYKQVAEAVGPQGAQVLNDLYAISRRMAEGENKLIRTGASNQPLLNALNAEGLISKLMKGTAVRTAATATTTGVGAVAGGPAGAVAGATLAESMQDALEKGGKTRLEKLHTLLSSDAMRNLVEKAGTGQEKAAVSRLIGSKEWNNFAAKVLGLKTPDQRRQWIENAVRSAATVGGVEAGSSDMPQSTIEVR